MINGDSYFEYNLFKFLKKKISTKSVGKILLVSNQNYKNNSKLGNLKLTKNKIKYGGKLMNAGVYYLKPNINILRKTIFRKKYIS